MNYMFEILGVSPVLSFFSYQQVVQQKHPYRSFEYLGAHKCTLDAFMQPLEAIAPERGWEPDLVLQALVDFWIQNSERIHYWQARLVDAGAENLLVARVANTTSLKTVFESLLQDLP